MKRVRTLATAACAAVLLAAACTFDLTEPPANTPAVFSATIEINDSVRTAVLLNAVLDPGRDADGAARSLSSETLQLLGRRIEPTAATAAGVLTYQTEFMTAMACDTVPLRLTLPVLRGGPSMPSVLEAPRTCRAGLDTITLTEGDPVRLAIETGTTGAENVQRSSWEVRVVESQSGRRVLQISGEGLPPDTIILPLEPSGDSAPTEFSAWLTTSAAVEGSEGGAPTRMLVSARLFWSIQVLEAAQRE